ncbi:phage tail spike protein, partial [Ligilactobacillus ruminis]
MIMYLLDKQQRIIKAVDKVIIEATMIEEINTANQLTFSVMTNSRIDTAIQYVCIPAPRGDAFLMFKLTSETVKNDRVEYTAIESAYDELKAYSYIKDMRPSGKTAGQMLEQVIQGTRWSLGYIADTNQSSSSFYYVTVLEAIQKIVELFNVELTFDVNIDKKTNIISSRRINLYTQQGRRTGKRFEYGSNLLEVTREQSSENLITALVGRGKGEEVSQGEDGSPDGYGRRITFADVEWKKANGNPADKPRGQEYVEDKDATALYGFSDGSPRIGLTTFEDITDPKELLKATWASLQIAKRPQVSFKASVIDVGDLALGDTVAIIRHDLGIEYFTRVYKVEHDLLNEANNTIELGDDFSQKSLTSYIADVTKITENAKNTAEYAVNAANGKNKNYYSKTKPQYANEGDNLFLDLGNGETELYAWHNGNWELVVSTADTTAVKRQVDQVIKDFNAHFKEIDDKYVPNETYQTEKQAFSTAVTKASE